jgi:hypothetical protein
MRSGRRSCGRCRPSWPSCQQWSWNSTPAARPCASTACSHRLAALGPPWTTRSSCGDTTAGGCAGSLSVHQQGRHTSALLHALRQHATCCWRPAHWLSQCTSVAQCAAALLVTCCRGCSQECSQCWCSTDPVPAKHSSPAPGQHSPPPCCPAPQWRRAHQVQRRGADHLRSGPAEASAGRVPGRGAARAAGVHGIWDRDAGRVHQWPAARGALPAAAAAVHVAHGRRHHVLLHRHSQRAHLPGRR